MNFFS